MSRDCADDPRTSCKESIVRSKDGGRSWDVGYTVDNPAPTSAIETILPDRLGDSVVFIATRNVGSTPSFSVRRSADRGSTFSALGSAFQGLGSNGLAVDGANPETLYAATSDGIWAYTLAKTAVATATPSTKATATVKAPTATKEPAATATTAPPTQTTVATAKSAATPSPTAPDPATATRPGPSPRPRRRP